MAACPHPPPSPADAGEGASATLRSLRRYAKLHFVMIPCYIALGANLGDATHTIHRAIEALDALPNSILIQSSPLYRSAPVDATGPDFINAVVELETKLTPEALLAQLQHIEQAFGRERPYPNAPRTLDLDLLLFGDQRIHTDTLTVPHPRMLQRAFVLRPLLDVAPNIIVAGVAQHSGLAAAFLGAVAEQACVRVTD
jgi:2-amino-4-hydroxy-6-hydroxymethyldihydropteridine diphosphokinase